MEREWRCQNKVCNAKLGVITWNGSGVPTLMLLRHSIDMNVEQPQEVDVLGPVMGQMPVRCELCGHVSFWDVSLDALAYLIRQLRPEQMEQLQIRLVRGHVRKVTRKNRAALSD